MIRHFTQTAQYHAISGTDTEMFLIGTLHPTSIELQVVSSGNIQTIHLDTSDAIGMTENFTNFLMHFITGKWECKYVKRIA